MLFGSTEYFYWLRAISNADCVLCGGRVRAADMPMIAQYPATAELTSTAFR